MNEGATVAQTLSLIHIFHGVTDLFFGVLTQRIGDGHSASSYGNAHSAHLLPRDE